MNKKVLLLLVVFLIVQVPVGTALAQDDTPPWWPTPGPQLPESQGGWGEVIYPTPQPPARDWYCLPDERSGERYCFDRNSIQSVTVGVRYFDPEENRIIPVPSAQVEFRYVQLPRDARAEAGVALDSCTTGASGDCVMHLPFEETGSFLIKSASVGSMHVVDEAGYSNFIENVKKLQGSVDLSILDYELPYVISVTGERQYYLVLYPAQEDDGVVLSWGLFQQTPQSGHVRAHYMNVFSDMPEALPASISTDMVNGVEEVAPYYGEEQDAVPKNESDPEPVTQPSENQPSPLVIFLWGLLVVVILAGLYIIYDMYRDKFKALREKIKKEK